MARTIKPVTMHPITIKKISFWQREIDDTSTAFADALKPLVEAGADLRAVMRYRHFREKHKGVVEVYQTADENSAREAQTAGFTASAVPALLVETDHIPGVEYSIANVLAEVGARIIFAVTQAVGEKCSAILGFETDADAERVAASLVLMNVAEPQQGKE